MSLLFFLKPHYGGGGEGGDGAGYEDYLARKVPRPMVSFKSNRTFRELPIGTDGKVEVQIETKGKVEAFRLTLEEALLLFMMTDD